MNWECESVRTADSVSERGWRDAFGRFATGVAVATCITQADEPLAVTINSFTSISLSPPIISFSLGQRAHCLKEFEGTSSFAIQILDLSQVRLARMFSRPMSSRWSEVPHRKVGGGHVLIIGCAASFLCHRLDRHPVGDHIVFYGLVQALETGNSHTPLAFHSGRFGCVCPAADDIEPASAASGWGG
jgi:flavin reductase (DIM6/NTAB) family NADH-FMN oxidoreductase RutF